MYVITVEFDVLPEHLASFRKAMRRQADTSLEGEPGCRQFDVCYDVDETARCFLYEKYDDLVAFELHRATEHMAEFNATVKDWIKQKRVQAWNEEVSE